MAFNSLLKDIISKTVQQYSDTACSDPEKFESSDTFEDEILDSVIKDQEKERKELWAHYYKLKRNMKETENDKVFEESVDENTQLVLGLIKQQELLEEEILRQSEQLNTVTRTNLVEGRVAFKDNLQKSLTQLRLALKYLTKESEDLSAKINNENLHLRQAEEMQLKVATSTSLFNATNVIRERIRVLEYAFKSDTNSLIEFLNKFFPPPDDKIDSGSLESKDSMLDMVEELMNRAILNPDDPYVHMVAGSYWTPHLQTLIKAGVATYHPEDPRKVRLMDFTV